MVESGQEFLVLWQPENVWARDIFVGYEVWESMFREAFKKDGGERGRK
jgi:hypothetical protein